VDKWVDFKRYESQFYFKKTNKGVYEQMKASRYILIIIAAIVWYSGGIVLLLKGGALIKSAYLIDAQSYGTFTAALVGVAAGLLKGKFLFSKSCQKNIERIRALTRPRIWQFLRPGMLIFLAVMIPAGVWMSSSAAGNYTLLCLVGALDLSISFALLTSSMIFWKFGVFSPAGN